MLHKLLSALKAKAEPAAARDSAASASQDAKLADRFIEEGNRAENAGDLATARARYEDAVRAAPDHAAAHLNLGIARFAVGDTAGAIASYERALAIEPRQPFVNYNYAMALRAQGELPRAADLLRTALAAKPDFVEALIVLANVQESRGQVDDAAASLRAALAPAPGSCRRAQQPGHVASIARPAL